LLNKDLKLVFYNYWFYIILLIISILFNYKFYILLMEYFSLFTNYTVNIRDDVYTPYQSFIYIFSNLAAYISYFLIFLVSFTNSKFAMELEASHDKFDILYFKLSFFSYINLKTIVCILSNFIYIIVPYFLLFFIYPFYKFDIVYLLRILTAHFVLIIIFSSISLCFSLINFKYYFSLILSFIFSLTLYYFLLEEEFLVFYKGGFNYNLLFISILIYLLFTFINYKIYDLRRYI